MPRLHIHVQDIEDVEELEAQEDWETELGLGVNDHRRELRDNGDRRTRGERRFGGSESIDRRRSERRKQVRRYAKRV
jgi:hypothetical protein